MSNSFTDTARSAKSASQLAICLLLAICAAASGGPKRLVIIKADGLPSDVIDRWVHTVDPETGRSALPWIEQCFLRDGAWVRNFYTRGISLSASSWSMLDSGRHLVIRGNAEYDRYTLRVYDYLNFFPFYLSYARSRRADMPAVEVMDEAGIPLLIDRFQPLDRYQSMQLMQRTVRWRTLRGGLQSQFASKSARQIFDEWQTGFDFSRGLSDQVERDIVKRIHRGDVHYLDYFFGDYDHVGHLANDPQSALGALKKLDALVGRLWQAIQSSAAAADTLFVLLSDHGMNSEPGTYSQGYNLIGLFGSAAGGSHHVITNRHPLTEYKIKGLDPLVSEVTTPSGESLYLRDQASQYPTALMDLDGNERASIHLRNNAFNRIQILRQAGGDPAALAKEIERNRASWSTMLSELNQELAALARVIEHQRALVALAPKKFTKQEIAAEIDDHTRRERSRQDSWEQDERGYRGYANALQRMLDASGEVPRRAMGEPNSIYDLQNYTAGPKTVINYFQLLAGIRVRNNVQAGVGPRPVDFVAAAAREGIFLYGDEEHEALILVREGSIRYQPVARLRQSEAGELSYDPQPWAAGFPLRLYEDANLAVAGNRAVWLDGWHTDAEWLEATHRCAYSNGVVGLLEHFGPLTVAKDSRLWRDAGADAPLLRRFELRKRRLVAADMLIVAANHWNFNVRGFNPGGNHGSFLRASTHSTLMLTGAGVPRGLVIKKPYDSLSFFPTILKLAGIAADSEIADFPGPVIQELSAGR